MIDRERFTRELARRFVLRGHMVLILVAVALSGVVTSKLLLLLGLGSMRTRYGVAVAAAYLVFIALVGLWLMYVRRSMAAPSESARARSSSSVGLLDFDIGAGAGTGSGPSVPRFSSGGGSFGGGGASGSYADAAVVARGSSRSGSRWGSWGFDGDLDDGIWIVIAFIVFVSVIAVTGGFMIYDAPHMFGEAAFQFFLASGLFRSTRALKSGGWTAALQGGWTGVVVRRTAIPFVIVAVAAVVFGHVVQKLCPEARSAIEAFRFCVGNG